MKKIIFIFVLLFCLKWNVFATDSCEKIILQEASFIWEVILNANLRNYPCVDKSSVIWSASIWKKFNIISKVDGWYKIENEEGSIYWIWDKAIKKTSDIIQTKSNYKLSTSDTKIINSFISKVDKIVQKKGISYKNNLASKIVLALKKKKYNERITAILENIVIKINKIEIVVEKQLTETIKKEEIIESVKSNVTDDIIWNIDLDKVKSTWLNRFNKVRQDLWRKDYSYDPNLDATASEWSKISKERWEISHKRNVWDSYYDYDIINSWFKEKGVVCKNIYRVTHTENTWWGMFSCNDNECTDELIKSVRSNFDFYMSEKDDEYKPHYLSITNNYFTKIWFWIELEKINSSSYKYYLTTHYCTELIK